MKPLAVFVLGRETAAEPGRSLKAAVERGFWIAEDGLGSNPTITVIDDTTKLKRNEMVKLSYKR